MTDIQNLFQNKQLLNQALQLSRNGKRAGYERLEFLGDRVIGLVVSEMLYRIFPKEQEGALAKRFVALVREETLADVARQIGLDVLMNTNEDELRHNNSVLSDLCESVMAALYLDKGLDIVKEFMEPIWMPLIRADIKIPQDSKSTLQEWAQKKHKQLPVYQLLERSGPDHQPVFTVSVTVGKKTVVGTGNNKKLAEQAAAETFLKEYKNGYK